MIRVFLSRLVARVKDPRVPGTILLLMLSLGCSPGYPPRPMGGIKNTLSDDVAARGRVRGTSFDAVIGPGSTLWVKEERDNDARVEVLDASGFTIDRSVELESFYSDLRRYEVVKTGSGYAVWVARPVSTPGDSSEYGPPAR